MPPVTAPMPTTMTSPAGTGPLGGVSGRGGADPRLLKEIDTLIAFEDYAQAASMLRDLIDRQPRNAEYRLRLLHVESATGNEQASEVEEEILASIMMDGPLSATINRVLCAGRDMLPGHPLFSGTPWDAPAEEVPRSAADGAPTIELEQPRRAPSQD